LQLVSSSLPPTPSRRWRQPLLFVLSAAAAAGMLRIAWQDPTVGIAVLGLGAGLLGSRWISRRRTDRLLRSGDIEGILGRWSAALARVPHAETMGPLMAATAFAAHGWVERARAVLGAAPRGPAWDAALEHRLFLDALLFTFEGDSGAALDRAGRLARLPMPTSAPLLAGRIRTLRAAVGALARAFSHQGGEADRRLLLEASDTSPLVHWAMRYGAAILAVDANDLAQARALLAGAPEWPDESCFRRFHREILAEIERRG
jgi:hypothetical protein